MGNDIDTKPKETSKTPQVIRFGGENILKNIIVKYDDDEVKPEKEIFETNGKENNNKSNLEEFYKNTEFKLKFSHNNFDALNKSTIYYLILSLRVSKLNMNNNINFIPSSRNPCDIVCVIDRSFSMKGEKIEFVKKSLNAFLEFFLPEDRLCLIAFDDKVERLCPLTFTDKRNLENFFPKIIDKLKPVGGTNIASATQHAMEVILQRKNKTNFPAIILLSDGIDKDCDLKIKNLMSNSEFLDEKIIIHTFGYGKDHDPKTMSKISESGNGDYYYIDEKQLDTVLDCLASCFGNISSLVAKNTKITIKDTNVLKIKKLVGDQFNLRKIDSKEKLNSFLNINENDSESFSTNRSYSKMIKNNNNVDEVLIHKSNEIDLNNDCYEFKYGNVTSDRIYNFVVELESNNNKSFLNELKEKENQNLKFSAYVEFDSLVGDCSINFLSNLEVPIKAFKNSTELYYYNNNAIYENFDYTMIILRAKCGEILYEARAMCQKYENAKAVENVKTFLNEVETYLKLDHINSQSINENFDSTLGLKTELNRLKSDIENFILVIDSNRTQKTCQLADIYEGVNSYYHQKDSNKYGYSNFLTIGGSAAHNKSRAVDLKSKFFLGK